MEKKKYEIPLTEVMNVEPIIPLARSIREDNDADSKQSTFDDEDTDMDGFGFGKRKDAIDAEWTWK